MPVPSGIIEALLTESDESGITSLTSVGAILKGMKVRVQVGPFAGQQGEVTDVLTKGRDRVLVLLNMLGAEARVPLPSYALGTL